MLRIGVGGPAAPEGACGLQGLGQHGGALPLRQPRS